MNDTLQHTDTPADQPRVHHDPLGGYGYTPDPITGDPWSRAVDAEQAAEQASARAARWLADSVLTRPWGVEGATQAYRRAKAGYAYATAVRQVESQRRWPKGGVTTTGGAA